MESQKNNIIKSAVPHLTQMGDDWGLGTNRN